MRSVTNVSVRLFLLGMAVTALLLVPLAPNANASTMYYTYTSGSGEWQNQKWSNSPGGPYDQFFVGGSDAVFEGNSNSIFITTSTPPATAQASSMTFNQSGTQEVICMQGDLTLVGSGALVVTNGALIKSENGNGLAGSVGLTRSGGAVLELRGPNPHLSGTVALTDGLTGIHEDLALGAVPTSPTANAVTFNGGAVLSNGGPAENVTIAANRGITMNGLGRLKCGWDDTMTINSSITGSGELQIVSDSGTIHMAGDNTYTGSTWVGGKLTLDSTGSMLMDVNDGGSNRLYGGFGGVCLLNLDGTLNLDVAGVTGASGSWSLIDVANLNETYGGNFAVAMAGGSPFTESSGVWSYSSGSRQWSFAESTGTLSLTTIPEPSTLILLGMGLVGLLCYAWKKRK